MPTFFMTRLHQVIWDIGQNVKTQVSLGRRYDLASLPSSPQCPAQGTMQLFMWQHDIVGGSTIRHGLFNALSDAHNDTSTSSLVPCLMLLTKDQPHLHQPWRLAIWKSPRLRLCAYASGASACFFTRGSLFHALHFLRIYPALQQILISTGNPLVFDGTTGCIIGQAPHTHVSDCHDHYAKQCRTPCSCLLHTAMPPSLSNTWFVECMQEPANTFAATCAATIRNPQRSLTRVVLKPAPLQSLSTFQYLAARSGWE